MPVSRSVCVLVAALAAAARFASAQFIEGFEHGDWAGHYTAISGSGSAETLSAAAARSGNYGAQLSTGNWWKNLDAAAALTDGDTYSFWVRGTMGRFYLGFTSDDPATQAYTVVAAPNTGNLLIQRNSGFGYTDLAASEPIAWSGSAFYEVVVGYDEGVLTAEAFTATGESLAPPIAADTGYISGGAMLLRGFSGVQVDDVEFGGQMSRNALVLDFASVSGIGASATAAAGLLPLVTTSPEEFIEALGQRVWRMVVIDNPSTSFDAAASNAIAGYIAGGGRVHMSYWNLDADPALQQAFGVAGAADFFEPRPVFRRGEHPSWGDLTMVSTGVDMWHDNGDMLTPAVDCHPGAPQVAGAFDSPGSGAGAIVTARGRTLLNGFDYDSMDLPAVQSLVTSQIRWLRSVEPRPAPGPTGCIADCDGNGEIDFFDFLCFQNDFAAGSCEADCDRNGELDFFDFLCFQEAFAAGCAPLRVVPLGVEVAPPLLCGMEVLAFPLDGRPLFVDVTDVPSPLGEELVFDIPCNLRRLGTGGWQWGRGYMGAVYYTNGAARVEITLPASAAFYFYMAPNPFADIEFEVTAVRSGEQVSVRDIISGGGFAKGFGICGGAETVVIEATDGVTDFAFGEFSIGK